MAITGADKSSLADSQPRQSLAHAFSQSSRSPSGFPQCFSGEINDAKLFNKTGHYSHAYRLLFAKPPKADIRRRELDVRFVPKADIGLVKVNAVSQAPKIGVQVD
jgi:hypothetical protein